MIYTGWKMRNTKTIKILSILLVLMLLMSGLAGCKKNNQKPEPAQQEEQEQQQEEQEETEEPAEEPAAEPAEEPSDNVEEEPVPVEADDSEDNMETEPEVGLVVYEDELYYTKDEVALYLHDFGHLPDNYITKKEAKKLGWSGGSLEKFAPGKVIGGDRFGNYEGLLPDDKGQKYYECDIDTLGKKKRGAKRIIWGDDGSIYYTEDHYESFELIYEGE